VGAEQTVAQVLDPATVLFRRLWQPLAVAALNTGTEEASARLLGRVLAETFAKGGVAYRPLVPREDLSQSFVEPALRHLTSAGAEIRFASRLRDIGFAEAHATRLGLEAGEVSLGADEAVILAVPAPVAVRLIPGLTAPGDFRAIVNAHYRLALPETAPLLMGIVGGTAEWVFRKREVVSVTVSAADRLVDMPAEELGVRLWGDVARAFELPLEPMPAVQIVKERRATFAATPAQLQRRPPTATRWANLTLAGDWTETGLPATIEGAIRSGVAAAERLLGAASAEVEKSLSRRRGRAKVAADLPSFH
jgi:squalene-associated FAD-dependent desaturase